MDGPDASPPRAGHVRGRWLPLLALSTVIAAYGLIIFGSHVRVTDSGMGCPDWPLCDGSLGPIHQFHAIMEQSHRYIAAVVTVLVLTTALLASRSGKGPATSRAAVFTAGVVVVQIGLGALTVGAGNSAPTVAAHLLTGLALLGGATVTAVCAHSDRRPATRRRLARAGWLAVSSSGVLFVSGSLVVNADAEKACASFPLCPGGQPAGLVALHLVHRGFAVLAGAALISFALHAWRRWPAVPRARAMAATLAALVAATAGLGISTAMLKAPAVLQDFHLAGAAAVLVATVSLAAAGWLSAADASTRLSVPDGPPPSDGPATQLAGTH